MEVTINDLIKRLSEIKAEHGNLIVSLNGESSRMYVPLLSDSIETSVDVAFVNPMPDRVYPYGVKMGETLKIVVIQYSS